jgi:hypothetical protein
MDDILALGHCTDARRMRDHQHDRFALRTLAVALAVALGGCSASEIVQNWNGAPAADAAEPNYRRIVADNIKTLFPGQAVSGMEISGVRPVDHLKGPSWLTCLKFDAGGTPQHFAIFIQGDKIIDSRAGVVIDGCHRETYTPLELSTAEKKPPG